jgi:hypothetical protein
VGLVIGYLNAVRLGAVAASSSVGGLGPDQLQNDQGNSAQALQFSGTTGCTITVTWSGLYHAFGIFRHNLTPGATVTFTVKNGGSTVLTGTALASVPGFRQSVWVAGAPVFGTSCVISIADAGNPDGHVNVPLAFVGPVFQPARNMTFQSSFGRAQQVSKAITRSGGVIPRLDWLKRIHDVVFSGIKEAELSAITEIDLAGRQGSNLLFVPNPASLTINTEAIFGEFEPQSNVGYFGQNRDFRSWSARLTERL